MNIRLVVKLLGIVALLIGGTMIFSLPWAHGSWGYRDEPPTNRVFEAVGFRALLLSMVLCTLVGAAMVWWGRAAKGQLFRKEAMAVVGLSWLMATFLGALPFILSDCFRSPGVRLMGPDQEPLVYSFNGLYWGQWLQKPALSIEEHLAVTALLNAGADGLNGLQLQNRVSSIAEADAYGDIAGDPASVLRELARSDDDWSAALLFPRDVPPEDRRSKYRICWVPVGLADALFESQSGFSTTGATILSDLENPALVPHCILFWRSSTHFLGGLGIIVLFVVILGQGSAGKALMRAEMPGPSKEGAYSRMQHTAWLFAGIYCGLNLLLTVILKALGLTWFDALCHSFGTMATGGFSTYNASVRHFESSAIDYVIILFMVLAGTNFTLLYFLLLAKPGKLLADVEWRTYMVLIGLITALVMAFGLASGDFKTEGSTFLEQTVASLRYGLFQVVSIITTTGYGTNDFDQWNSFGRGILFMLMFVGGCAGSTGGGMKVIRHILFHKILLLELEQSFHPTVVRPLRLGGNVVDENIRKNILVYFGMILFLFVVSWLFVVTLEPDLTWGADVHHKLIDSASAIAATLNNIGPGLGTVGATQNYGHFSAASKLLFTMLMMIGRVEIFAILVLFSPRFWRAR